MDTDLLASMECPLLCVVLIVAVTGIPVPKVEKYDPTLPQWKVIALKIIRRQEPDNKDWANDDKVAVVSVSSEDFGSNMKYTIKMHTTLVNNHDDVCIVTFYKLPQSTSPSKPYAECFCPK